MTYIVIYYDEVVIVWTDLFSVSDFDLSFAEIPFRRYTSAANSDAGCFSRDLNNWRIRSRIWTRPRLYV